MDRYPLHQQFIPAHGKLMPVNYGAGASIYRPAYGKLMPVKLGGRCIDLLTGAREINAGQIRGSVH